jgi:molybdopterin-binding protein
MRQLAECAFVHEAKLMIVPTSFYRLRGTGCGRGIRLHCLQHCAVNTMAGMKISARNQLPGKVETIVLGVVTAKVGVRVGENLIESVITRQSVEDLGIKVGDAVTAVIKSTEIMLMVL